METNGKKGFKNFIKKNWALIIIPLFVFLTAIALFNWLQTEFLRVRLICEENVNLVRYTYIPDATYWKFDQILKEISSREYDIEDYNCVDFSTDLQRKLRKIGIESRLVTGTDPDGGRHQWVSILVESITGKFISPNENYIQDLPFNY